MPESVSKFVEPIMLLLAKIAWDFIF